MTSVGGPAALRAFPELFDETALEGLKDPEHAIRMLTVFIYVEVSEPIKTKAKLTIRDANGNFLLGDARVPLLGSDKGIWYVTAYDSSGRALAIRPLGEIQREIAGPVNAMSALSLSSSSALPPSATSVSSSAPPLPSGKAPTVYTDPVRAEDTPTTKVMMMGRDKMLDYHAPAPTASGGKIWLPKSGADRQEYILEGGVRYVARLVGMKYVWELA